DVQRTARVIEELELDERLGRVAVDDEFAERNREDLRGVGGELQVQPSRGERSDPESRRTFLGSRSACSNAFKSALSVRTASSRSTAGTSFDATVNGPSPCP